MGPDGAIPGKLKHFCDRSDENSSSGSLAPRAKPFKTIATTRARTHFQRLKLSGPILPGTDLGKAHGNAGIENRRPIALLAIAPIDLFEVKCVLGFVRLTNVNFGKLPVCDSNLVADSAVNFEYPDMLADYGEHRRIFLADCGGASGECPIDHRGILQSVDCILGNLRDGHAADGGAGERSRVEREKEFEYQARFVLALNLSETDI